MNVPETGFQVTGVEATPEGLRVSMEGADAPATDTFDMVLALTGVLGLSMILHELYTNAVKYGALCTDEGQVVVDWDWQANSVKLIWTEVGPPCDRDSHGTGLGERMIAMSAKSDLRGTIDREWHPEGLIARLQFPLII